MVRKRMLPKRSVEAIQAKFRATKALTDDLEYLILKGFEQDGPKKGKNKYTPMEALTFLQNMTSEDGRRKYSDRSGNPNGPLPTKQYIQSFFYNRKKKMEEAEVNKSRRSEQQLMAQGGSSEQEVNHIGDANGEDVTTSEEDQSVQFHQPSEDYSKLNINDLTAIAKRRFAASKLAVKMLYINLLKNDDIIRNNNENTHNRGYTTRELREICTERHIFKGDSPNTVVKPLLIAVLERNDKAKQMQSCQRMLDPIIARHEVENERLKQGILKID